MYIKAVFRYLVRLRIFKTFSIIRIEQSIYLKTLHNFTQIEFRERSRDSWDRRDRKRYSSPERYREQGIYSEERNYPVYEKRRGYPENYDRYTENEYPPFPTRYRDRQIIHLFSFFLQQ